MATLYMSDSHFGLDVPEAERVAAGVTKMIRKATLGETEIAFVGDLMVGWKQQMLNPGWESRLQTQAGAFIDLLKTGNATVLAGNCEQAPEMERIGMGQLPYATYDEHTRVLATHGHVAEPRSVFELARNLAPAITSGIPSIRKMLEKLMRTRDAACFDKNGTAERVQQALANNPLLQTVLEQNDHERHVATTGIYNNLTRIADMVSVLRRGLDALVHCTLDDYYAQILVFATRELIRQQVLPADVQTIVYGHTHRPFIKNRQQLQKQFNFGKGWLPEYFVNDGTMVPLTKKNGGSDDSHFVLAENGAPPKLFRTTSIPQIELVNVGGEPTSHIFTI